MSDFNVEEIISKISSADEIEIMEFDFNDCFTALREMEFKITEQQKELEFYRKQALDRYVEASQELEQEV